MHTVISVPSSNATILKAETIARLQSRTGTVGIIGLGYVGLPLALLFAEEGFRALTLTCVKNNRGIDVLALAKKLREKHHLVIDPGYGKIRGKTFRLSNMGDETEETVAHLIARLDDCLPL